MDRLWKCLFSLLVAGLVTPIASADDKSNSAAEAKATATTETPPESEASGQDAASPKEAVPKENAEAPSKDANQKSAKGGEPKTSDKPDADAKSEDEAKPKDEPKKDSDEKQPSEDKGQAEEPPTLPAPVVKKSFEDMEPTDVWITSLAPIGSSKFLATGASGLLLRPGGVFSFDVGQPTELKDRYKHDASAWASAALPGGEAVATVDYRGNLMWFDLGSEQATPFPSVMKRWTPALAASPDGKFIVGGNEAGELLVWNVQNKAIEKKQTIDEAVLSDLSFSPDNQRLAVADSAGHVHVLQWPSLESTAKIEIGDAAIGAVAFFGNDALIVGCNDRNLYRVAVDEGAKPQRIVDGTDWFSSIVVRDGEAFAGDMAGNVYHVRLGGSDLYKLPSSIWDLVAHERTILAATRKHGVIAIPLD